MGTVVAGRQVNWKPCPKPTQSYHVLPLNGGRTTSTSLFCSSNKWFNQTVPAGWEGWGGGNGVWQVGRTENKGVVCSGVICVWWGNGGGWQRAWGTGGLPKNTNQRSSCRSTHTNNTPGWEARLSSLGICLVQGSPIIQ